MVSAGARQPSDALSSSSLPTRASTGRAARWWPAGSGRQRRGQGEVGGSGGALSLDPGCSTARMHVGKVFGLQPAMLGACAGRAAVHGRCQSLQLRSGRAHPQVHGLSQRASTSGEPSQGSGSLPVQPPYPTRPPHRRVPRLTQRRQLLCRRERSHLLQRAHRSRHRLLRGRLRDRGTT